MEIEILHLIEGAHNARGLTVVIDVFRAFTTACYIMRDNPAHLYCVGDINEAYRLKQQNPASVLIGERNEQMPEGFDFANSPTQIEHFPFAGTTVIHTTSSGTQGVVHAVHADEIITGSFVNIGAVISYIRNKSPRRLSLVCMGYAAQYPTDEDTFCAEYIRDSLTGQPPSFESLREILRRGSGSRFFDPVKQAYAPERDFYLCTTLNTFDFVLRAVPGSPVEMMRC